MNLDPITEFNHEFRFLSNFWPAPLELDNIFYPTAEHAYVAYKTTDVQLRVQISEIETPGKVKRFGRDMELREDWDTVKLAVMTRIVTAKFEQNPDLMPLLMKTAPRTLIEGNSWGDTFWGESPIGTGKNNLGKILMAIRDDITRRTYD